MNWKQCGTVLMLMLMLMLMLGLAALAADARVPRHFPDLGDHHVSLSRDVLVTVQLVSVRDVAANGQARAQDSTLTLRQLVSLRSHYAGSMQDTERRSHAPLACWGALSAREACGPGQRFTGNLKVRPGTVHLAVFRFDARRWQAGDALTVHTQLLALSANEREASLQHLREPVMKAIPLREALEAERRGEASNYVIRLQAGQRTIEMTYNVRITSAS